MDSLRGSSVNIGTIQRRLAWPLRKDDAHTSLEPARPRLSTRSRKDCNNNDNGNSYSNNDNNDNNISDDSNSGGRGPARYVTFAGYAARF